MVLNFFFFYAFIHKVAFHINLVWSFFIARIKLWSFKYIYIN